MNRAKITLDGDWRLARYTTATDVSAGSSKATDRRPPDTDGLEWIGGTVPGAVPLDLVAAGKLANPLGGVQAARDAAWVAESDWLYATDFGVDSTTASAPKRYLLLDGVDTFADVWLNGTLVGSTGNMFRFYRLDVSRIPLKADGNILLIHVKSHYPPLADRVEAAKRIVVDSHPNAYKVRSLIRRYQRSFNTSLLNLGVEVISIGVYGSVALLACSEVHVEDYQLVVQSATVDAAHATVDVRVNRDGSGHGALRVEARLWDESGDSPICTGSVETSTADATVPLTVTHPRLWWPRGYGEPHLYTLTVSIYRGQEKLDGVSRKVGIKQTRLVQREPSGKPTFYLEVNSRKVYVRGGNLMPIDALKARVSPPEYHRLLRLAANANMNLIRIWGGGVPEHESFLDQCDAMGIMIWQDFFYHSGTYPDYDPEFLAEAEREAIGLIRYMRSHACLALLCGGNEQLQGWDEWNWKENVDRHYGEKLFTELLPDVCARHAPEIPYVPNSPHGGKLCQSPTVGDTHTWGNFYNATKDPLFVTETCWCVDSYSRPETLEETMGLDVDDLSALGWHRRWRELTGLSLISRFPYGAYQNVATLQDYLRALEIEQLEADFHPLSLLRLRSSSCNGIVYWPLNKGGPLFGFGCVDYAGRPLMAYYAVKRLFADVVIGLYRDVDDLRVVGSNLSEKTISGILKLMHLDGAGKALRSWEVPVALPPGNSARLHTVDRFMEGVVDRTDEMVGAALVSDAGVVSEDALYFCPLAEYDVAPGKIAVEARRIDEKRWSLDLASDRVARLVEIEASARLLLSDDYFTLVPGVKKTVQVETLEPVFEPVRLSIAVWDRAVVEEITLE